MKLSNYVVPILVIIVDQTSKYIIKNIWPEVIVLNQRGMWGILPAWAGIVGLLILGIWVIKQKNVSLVLWIILASGLSNIIDRLIYNGVVDWIHTFSWFPVFNIADMVITVSVVILLIKEINK